VRNDLGDGKNHLVFGGRVNGVDRLSLWHSPPVEANWHTLSLRVRLAADTSGLVQLWYDGHPQTFLNGSQTLRYQTLIPGSTYDGVHGNFLDINSYRPTDSIQGTVTLFHRAPAIGVTLAAVESAVAPTAGAP
jgi:hypothetical protein